MNHDSPTAYRVRQLGPPDEQNVQRNIPVDDLESLVTHHPRANAGARLLDGVPDGAENVRSRSYAVIGGEFQEVQALRTDRQYRSLQPDQVLLIKDFILDDMSARDTRRVDVPSPLRGFIGRVDAANGVVDIHATVDGPLVARLRHLGPIAVKTGDAVAYGQSLGTQNNIGLAASAGRHVHIEMDTRYHQQFEHYLLDLVEGRLAVQAAHRTGVEPRALVDDGVQRVGESGERVAAVQRALVAGGYRGAGDTPIAVDGVYRLSLQGAVLRFQQDHGLPASGDIDAPTWRAALDLTPGRRALPPPVADELPQRFSPAHQGLLDRIRTRLGQLDAPSGAAECDRERVACALLRLAVEHRLSGVDHVLVGDARADGSGARLFLIEGRLDDPAQRRAWMPLADALGPPGGSPLERAWRPDPAALRVDVDMTAHMPTHAIAPSTVTAPRGLT